MRYFVKCRYNGTRHHGWQSQKGTDKTIQGQIEKTLSTFLREEISIIGCGRTDAGVHASEYYFHFDGPVFDPSQIKYKSNSILSNDIYIDEVYIVEGSRHTRFDARLRAYEYHLIYTPDPFRQETAFWQPQLESYDVEMMKMAAQLLSEFDEFTTFCKTGSDEKSKICTIYKSELIFSETGIVYHVHANRFLRGMIRLIVGMILNVGKGQVDIEEVKKALKKQTRLTTDWSVPAKGLFLSKVEYPFELE